jgi:hypothetical protein
MKSNTDKKTREQKHEGGVLLAPLLFEDILCELIQIKPPPKKR